MSAIPPPPIPSIVEEAYEVSLESTLALESLRASDVTHALEPRARERTEWLSALAWPAFYALGAAAVWSIARTRPSRARSVALALCGMQLVVSAVARKLVP